MFNLEERGTILVIDDNPTNLQVLQRIPGLCSTVAAVCKPVFKVLNINQIKRSS